MIEILRAISAEFFLVLLASGMYLAGAFFSWPAWRWLAVSIVGLIVAAVAMATCSAHVATDATALVSTGALAQFGAALALAAGLAMLLLNSRVAERETGGEYFASLLLVVAGGMLVAKANELVLLFLSLELISLPTYLLLCLSRRDAAGQESTAKYFYLSIFSSAVFLFGLSSIYGFAGTTDLSLIGQQVAAHAGELPATLVLGLTLVVAGLSFKMAAVPFHFYAPDVYQGTTNAAAAVLAWAPKIAGLLAVVRLAVLTMPALGQQSPWLWWLLAAVTMTTGNVLGLLQTHLRRLLAYSGIAHVGYLLIGVGAASAGSGPFLTGGPLESVAFYLVAYAGMSFGVFAAIAYLHSPQRPVENIDDLAGLGRTQPLLAASIAAMLIGLTGIPITAGFWGKLAVFASAVNCREPMYLWLAVIGVINAAISSYYYLRIIGAMYMRPAPERPVQPAGGLGPLTVALAGAFLTVAIGVVPAPFLDLVRGLEAERLPAAAISADRPAEDSSPRVAQSVSP